MSSVSGPPLRQVHEAPAHAILRVIQVALEPADGLRVRAKDPMRERIPPERRAEHLAIERQRWIRNLHPIALEVLLGQLVGRGRRVSRRRHGGRGARCHVSAARPDGGENDQQPRIDARGELEPRERAGLPVHRRSDAWSASEHAVSVAPVPGALRRSSDFDVPDAARAVPPSHDALARALDPYRVGAVQSSTGHPAMSPPPPEHRAARDAGGPRELP